MNINLLVSELKRDEGFVSHAYQDHLGFWTIGIGRLVDQRRGGGISMAEAEYLLANDISRVWSSLRLSIPWFDRLTDTRKRALVNMAFQLGVNGLLNFRRTLTHLEAGRYDAAAKEALNSNWARQTPARAKRISDMIKNG